MQPTTTERGPHLDTQAIHAGSTRIGGAVVLPVFQCSSFEHSGVDVGGYEGTVYPRLSNLPNHLVLGQRLAAIESAEAGLVTASGMSAIFTSLLAVLEPSTHLLVQDRLYGGTYELLRKILSPLNVTFDLVDAVSPESWEGALRPNTVRSFQTVACSRGTSPAARPSSRGKPYRCSRTGVATA